MRATASPGEQGSGITSRIHNKPGMNKGGQTVVMSDVVSKEMCDLFVFINIF